MLKRALVDRLLARATFGPAPGDRDHVMELGPEAWLAGELAAPDSAVPVAPPASGRLPSREMGRDERRERRKRFKELARDMAGSRVARAVHAQHSLREVMVDFWFNHFNVFAGKGPIPLFLPHYETEVIRRHALGRFEDLLVATARAPAMLFYLDNWRSSYGHSGRRKRDRGGLNENYARELLELHTLGVNGGYRQDDIIAVARVFTGWTLESRRSPEYRFRPRMHDPGRKIVLRETVRGEGVEEGEWLLRRLARHESTARHVGTKLARRFVADDPPTALIDRLATRFLETGGNIPSVLESLFLSKEFVAPEQRKLKTPLEFLASALRVSGGRTDGGRGTLVLLHRLGETPLHCRPPTGYEDRAERWLDPGAMLERIQLALALSFDRVPGTHLGPEIGPPERVALAFAAPEFQWQ